MIVYDRDRGASALPQFSFVPMAAAVLLSGLSPLPLRAGTVEPCGLNPMDHPTSA